MPYSTQTDITNLEMTLNELIQLTDDINAGTVDAAKVTAAISKADAEIDSYCQGQYAVPFGPSSEVIGTDTKNYTCIVAHTAAAINKPVTGANWATYWAQKGSSGAAYVTGTEYTAVPNIINAWSATLAAFNLYRNRPKPTTLIDRYNKVMSWLSDIAKNNAALPIGLADINTLPASTTDGMAQTFRRTQFDADNNLIGNLGTTDVW